MKVIFSCFAGRERYMSILSGYIDRLVSMNLVDEVHVWDYTRLESDAQWLRRRFNSHQIFEVEDKSTYKEYYQYYTSKRYPESDTVLIKCDDDIVYIDVDAFQSFVDARRIDPDAVFMSPFVINNPTCSASLVHIHDDDDFEDLKDHKLMSAIHAEYIHRRFLDGTISKPSTRFLKYTPNQMKLNINFIAILSKDFDVLFSNKKVYVADEDFLSVIAPNILKRPIVVDMHCFVAHMAFTNQRLEGFDETKLLEEYRIKEMTQVCK